MPVAAEGPVPLVLLLLAGILWYVTAHGGSAARTAGEVWRTAAAHALPVLAFAAVAAFRGQTIAASAAIVSFAVTSLSLVQGVTWLSIEAGVQTPDPRQTRGDGLLIGPIAAAVAVMLAGRLGWQHLPLILLPALAAGWASTHAITRAGQWGWLAVAVVPAVVGALCATSVAGLEMRHAQSLLASVLFAPMMALPMLGTCTHLAQRGHRDQAIAVPHRASLIAVGIGLPLAIACAAGSLDLVQRLWRLDGVLLLVLAGLATARAYAGLTLGRASGYLLIAGYLIYVATVVLRLHG